MFIADPTWTRVGSPRRFFPRASLSPSHLTPLLMMGGFLYRWSNTFYSLCSLHNTVGHSTAPTPPGRMEKAQ